MTGPGHAWRPSATLAGLRLRARALGAIRAFFDERGVLEVQTPALSAFPVSDPQLQNLSCTLSAVPGRRFYLHTSPEYHMKRLLAAGAPDIYQVCQVFRDGELGRWHEPEFTLIEWYRHGFDMADMLDETCALVAHVAGLAGRTPDAARQLSYREAFATTLGLDPIGASIDALREAAQRHLGDEVGAGLVAALGQDRNAWLDLLMSRIVVPGAAGQGLVAIHHVPAAQAALARLDPDDASVAERFEVYLDGVELANGFRELRDAGEQAQRFAADRAARAAAGLPDAPPDEALLAALDHGLPECSGVAVGLERLLMAATGAADIGEVVSFRVDSGQARG